MIKAIILIVVLGLGMLLIARRVAKQRRHDIDQLPDDDPEAP